VLRDQRLRLYGLEHNVEWISYLWDLFVHLNKHLDVILKDYGLWTYLILFVVIFCETGLVVTPFLPGDSLLFAAGALSAGGNLNPFLLFLLLSIAAIAGDTVNYWIGHYIGPRAFTGKVRFLKKEYLDRTHRFFEKYGGLTIVYARFVPIIRTFAPFVAGIGAMNYAKFIVYNVVGGTAWVALFVFCGWLLGEKLKEQFHFVILVIIVLSVMPMVFEYWRARRERRSGEQTEN
jgi:membrane-associated protein